MVAIHPHDERSKARAQVRSQAGAAPITGVGRRIGSVGVLYAHALLIEHEAAERYSEFAVHMAEHGNDSVAALFKQLAEFEAEHAFRLEKKTAGMTLPKLGAGEHAWIDQESPLPEAHAFVHRMLTPRLALEIALRAEERAKRFFERVLAEASDAGIREVAIDMARDEQAHIAWVTEALARVPQPYRPSEDLPGDPTIPQQL
jgi:erythrin-vacuolar iron transport family protein